MASRNGLNPKIRGPKGVGFGRALPAPFGFGNGLYPPGTAGSYLNIIPLKNKTWPEEGTIELWMRVLSARNQREVMVSFNDGSYLRLTSWGNSISAFEAQQMSSGAALPNGTYNYNQTYHVAYLWDRTNLYAWGNALLPNDFSNSAIATLTSPINLQIANCYICAQTDGNNASNSKLDELRFYNRKLSLSELIQNDNNGMGNNPSTTENLFVWYQFEKFEMLDFSALQDNSDMRLGIRDMSNNLNHAQVSNMDTNSTSDTYVLKPFN